MEKPDAGDEGGAGMPSQAVRELVMPGDCIHHVEKTLRSFAREALEHFQQERMELDGRIRIFCQKKMIEDACSEKSSRFKNIKQIIGQERYIRYSGLKMDGGWGYFLIIRGENYQEDGSVSPQNRIDLYIYKEGE
ncbi:MAG: hypothetical protein EHM41_19020 [Chloroflexi bacterium]|nr:MAG: hypothetical protein EHM41_19020 [Chloroflexota bacterium]